MLIRSLFILFSTIKVFSQSVWTEDKLPIVINTWAFTNATLEAWNVINQLNKTSVDAIVEGCSVCEREQCDGTVGYGGSPNELGETALDAMIMDGRTMNVGAVASMRNIKDAIAVARHVLENTHHTMLVGSQATDFAVQMGFKLESLSSSRSISMHEDWVQNNCQPNFWTRVTPDPSKHCGPYRPIQDEDENMNPSFNEIESRFHDTVGMVAIDRNRNIAAGTSTNGASHKISGRVGDSALPGSGAYAENSVGAAASTGDGDIMMRFLPSFLAVEFLRTGSTPEVAGQRALIRIGKYYPKYVGAIIVVDKDGNYGAACHGIDFFPYSVFHPRTKTVSVNKVKCMRSI